MARFAFQLRLRPDRIEAYEVAHREVWPELLSLLKRVGIEQYSIFRRGVDLFLYLNVADFEQAWREIDASPVNQRWQERMAAMFETPADLQPGERFPMMREVFFLE
jgi:L-rhamnose mutarotase